MSGEALRRGQGLGALLLALVDACGGASSEDSGTTFDCTGTPYDIDVMVPASAVDGLSVIGGNYPLIECETLCADALGDNVMLVDCRPPAAAATETTADASSTGGGSDATTNDGTGGSTGGEGTAGESTGDPGPAVSVTCNIDPITCSVGGRLNPALASDGRVAGEPHAAWFATMAHAEAASVVSFVRLAAALAHHGAPAELVARARCAARDEARHAAAMRRLAVARGAVPQRPRHRAAEIPTLEALARDNAVAGCVQETWAAMVMLWQGRHAADASVRDVLAAIAADEIRHAELAWAIDAWVMTRLDAAARDRVALARTRAADDLRGAVTIDQPALAGLGVPASAHARRLVGSMHAVLWS